MNDSLFLIHLIHLPLSPEDLAPSPAPSLGVGFDGFSAAVWTWSNGALLGAKAGTGAGVGVGPGTGDGPIPGKCGAPMPPPPPPP